jgi:hypothetical protein
VLRGFAVSDRSQGVDQVGGAGPVDLDAIDREIRVCRDRLLYPLESLLRRGNRVPGIGSLMGWQGARNEEDALEGERLPDLFRGAEMAQVDRIEGATEQTDASFPVWRLQLPRSWPSPINTNFRVVSPSRPMGP